MTPLQIRRFAVERLNDRNVETVYHYELGAELPGVSEPEPLGLDDKWKRVEEAVKKERHIPFDTQKQSGKEWFYGECACRANAI
jgi:hypothetical protein